MPMKAVIQYLLLYFLTSSVLAQIPEKDIEAEIEEAEINIPFEKVYLHTDKSHYFPNDTIWLKGYARTVPSDFDAPNFHSDALYVSLRKSGEEKILKKALVRMENGSGTANLLISDLESGDYILSAYTDLMRIWSEDYIFTKPLVVQDPGKLAMKQKNPEQILVSLHPESGLLIPGIKNKAVALVKDENGSPLDTFKGYLMNNKSDTICPLQMDQKGMCMVEFEPTAGETFFILGSGPDGNWKKHELPDFFQKGVLIQTDWSSHPEKLLISLFKSEEIRDQKFQMVAMSAGQAVYEAIFDMNEARQSMALDKDKFLPGVFNISILDESGQVLGERNVFLHPQALAKVTFENNTLQPSPRQKVSIDLEVLDEFDAGLEADLSISVIDLKQSGTIPSSNLSSHFLLHSYLDGGSTAFLPVLDQSDEKLAQKLDMLLMAFPLRNSLAKTLALQSASDEALMLPTGFQKTLQVLGEGGKPITEPKTLEVLVYPQNGVPEAVDVSTDAKGIFTLKGLYFQNTASLVIQEVIENRKGKKEKTPVKPGYIRVLDEQLPPTFAQSQFESTKETQNPYLNDVMRYRMLVEANAKEILLDTVEVENNRQRIDIPDKANLYGVNADITMEIPYRGYDHMNVFLYMRGRVPGMIMLGDPNDFGNPPRVFFRMGVHNYSFGGGIQNAQGALFLLNGVVIDKALIAAIPMGQVHRLDILNNVASANAYGARGASGVINVITKLGYARFNPPEPEEAFQLQGFHQAYNFREISEGVPVKDPFKNNLKSTIYWNPYLETDEEGRGELNFTLSDASSDFLVIVEGMSKTGEPIFGSFKVSSQE